MPNFRRLKPTRLPPATMILRLCGSLCWLLCAAAFGQGGGSGFPTLDATQLRWLGDQVYRNECNARPACLVAWNEGEDFPSLGIGHFIWYRQGQVAPFVETFPGLLTHLQQAGVQLPDWLAAGTDQPWTDRLHFLAEQDSARQRELRALLEQTRDLQTAYIVERFSRLQRDSAIFADRPALAARLQHVAADRIPYGLYALIDYVHFKGEGTSAAERYNGAGWGLVQVLEQMPADSKQPLDDFVASAKAVLSARVANAPLERNEQRWLAGWHHRVETYLPSTAR